ncbi:MAG: GNAT family N-acetyltransferase [Anaerolineales bacterium]|nr:GNAT family N-acetyltransferase [Anaerolineales bacterium]
MPTMITIRNYTEKDAPEVGRLIADTYSEFNLAFASPQEHDLMLGPFRHAHSTDEAHRDAIRQILQSPLFFVAEQDGQIAGVLRGRRERLASLFVHKDHQRRGVARRLVAAFENEMFTEGVLVIRVAATLYAVPFYQKLGYQKSTGVRTSWSFDGYGLPVQPMRKVLRQDPA